MTPEQYLEWLNSEIETAYWAEGRKISDNPQFYCGMKTAFISAKEKFLTIEYPQQETEPKEFTNGLE